MKTPLSGYVGGKSKLVPEILKRMPAHTCYVEPFAGAAWPLFAKEPSKVEVINDVNLNLITLYRCVQNHLEELVRQFKWILLHRAEFDRQKRVQADTLTDIQRAARFLYQLKLSFGGKVEGQVFGTSATAPPRFNLLRIEQALEEAHFRLARVLIECLPYHEVIRRYDRRTTFFYVDPPYYGTEHYYGRGGECFKRDDFAALAEQLQGIEGRFLLSLNDVPEVREIFSAFLIEPVATSYTVGATTTKAKEVFIRNFDI
ncbi:MAG: DNA adenine methylase [Desulfovibrionaceae bacterium]